MKKYKNRITTGIGFVIIIGAVISVFVGKADWVAASVGIAAGTGFIFTKDHNQS